MDIVDNLTHIGMLARRVTAAAEVPATVRPILLFECDTHRIANVLQRVHRRHWKVSTFNRCAVSHVAAFQFLAR